MCKHVGIVSSNPAHSLHVLQRELFQFDPESIVVGHCFFFISAVPGSRGTLGHESP
jgi:hypothetical protein